MSRLRRKSRRSSARSGSWRTCRTPWSTTPKVTQGNIASHDVVPSKPALIRPLPSFWYRAHAVYRGRSQRIQGQGVGRLGRASHHHEPPVRRGLRHHAARRQALCRHRTGRGNSQHHRPCALGPDQDRAPLPSLQLHRHGGQAGGTAARPRHAEAPPGVHRSGQGQADYPGSRGAVPGPGRHSDRDRGGLSAGADRPWAGGHDDRPALRCRACAERGSSCGPVERWWSLRSAKRSETVVPQRTHRPIDGARGLRAESHSGAGGNRRERRVCGESDFPGLMLSNIFLAHGLRRR
ncbi:hypothetical protein L209DRAFT_125535 [Thermothelomyces heterothallicus CBS 203.75]